MDQYNVMTPDSSVVEEIARNVIQYLMRYPEDSVDCPIIKVILDKKSRFSHESITNTANGLTFPLLFNGEAVDYHQFICRMFDMRENLVKRVRKRVEQHNDFSIIDPDKNKFLDKIVPIINKYVSTLIGGDN